MTRPLPPILLVDDEKNMRLSLSALLADDGYAVETVESAEQGEQLVDKREFLMLIESETSERDGASHSRLS